MEVNLENFTLTVLALEKLKLLGYNEVWVGPTNCPHWDWCVNGNLIASPKNYAGFRPAIWDADEKIFGKMGCGNGLKNADQMQRSNMKLIPGYYKLVDEKWETNAI